MFLVCHFVAEQGKWVPMAVVFGDAIVLRCFNGDLKKISSTE